MPALRLAIEGSEVEARGETLGGAEPGGHGMFEQSHAHFNIRDLIPGWMPPRSSPRPSLSAPHRPIHLLAPFRATRRGSTTALGRFCARPLSFFSVFLGEGGCAGMAGDVGRDGGSGSRPSDARQSIIASPVRASSSPNPTPSSAANARNDTLLPPSRTSPSPSPSPSSSPSNPSTRATHAALTPAPCARNTARIPERRTPGAIVSMRYPDILGASRRRSKNARKFPDVFADAAAVACDTRGCSSNPSAVARRSSRVSASVVSCAAAYNTRYAANSSIVAPGDSDATRRKASAEDDAPAR